MTFDLSNAGYDVVVGTRYQLPAGGYVCKIVRSIETKSKQGKTMIVLHLDIAEGKFAGYFARQRDWLRKYNPVIDWPSNGKCFQPVFDRTGKNINYFFVQTLEAVRKSNPDFPFNPKAFDPETLTGKLIGMVFGVDYYKRKDGTNVATVKPKYAYSVDDIRAGRFKIPETPPAPPVEDFTFGKVPVNDEDVPF